MPTLFQKIEFQQVFSLVDDAITANIASMVGLLIGVITPLLGACVGLYAVYLAYKALFEPQNLMVMESVKFLVALIAVTSIALNTNFYLLTVVPILNGLGDNIAVTILSSGGGVTALQSMFDSSLQSIETLWNSISISVTNGDTWKDAMLKFKMIVLYILGALAFLLVAFTYLLTAKLMMSILLVLGPLFIMMSFFPSTRSFFQAWTSQVFNYALLTITYPIAFSIFNKIVDELVMQSAINDATVSMTFIIFIALLLLSLQIPSFCSSLSGGVGINGLVGGLGAGIANIARMSKGMLPSTGSKIPKIPKGTNGISAG